MKIYRKETYWKGSPAHDKKKIEIIADALLEGMSLGVENVLIKII